MIFSYNWLKEFVPGIPEPKVLLEKLTLHSVEVEGITPIGENLNGIVVTQLLEKRKHPNADTLNIGLFDVGEDKPRQIIFGGKAVLQVGDKLSVALAPTVIPGGIKIEQKKLRGELSQGMCCLNSEIGILNNAAEVHFFEPDTIVGTPITEVLDLKPDYLLDIDNKSMTHRSDLFCHRGLAREIAAVFSVPVVLPVVEPHCNAALPLNVTVHEPKLCPRYLAAKLEVTIQPTPQFILARLQTCGIKAINNVVDITNYCMLEYGQPMHAFDAEKVSGNVQVRLAKNSESLRTLNDSENAETKLNTNILVIADDAKPLAIAGVIGGKVSAITSTTKQIILEVANFDAVAVRKSSQACGVRTDSVLRYEKGLPAELVTTAAARAMELLQQYAGGRITDYTDVNSDDTDKIQIKLNFTTLERVTGQKWETDQVKTILERLECTVKVGKDSFVVTPPWFRKDLQIPEDIIEEIVRIYGVENIPEQVLTGNLTVPKQEPEFALGRQMKQYLCALGLTEAYNYSFYGEQLISKVGLVPEEHIAIANPLSEDQKYLRTTLLPRLLETVACNQDRDSLAFFEIGHVYFTDREVPQLAIVVVDKENTYRKARGYVEALLQRLHVPIETKTITQTEDNTCVFWNMYEGRDALQCVSTAGKRDVIGTIGLIDHDVLKNLDIKHNVAFALLSIPVLTQYATTTFKLKPISAYPSIPLDLSLIVDETITWQQLETIVKQQAGELLQSLNVFDVYYGDKIPVGKKSLSFHMILQSQDKTLEMKAMEQWREKLVQQLNKKLGAELRAK